MQDIIKEYGPAIITIVAVVALTTLISALIGSDEQSIVGQAFTQLISDFFTSTSQAAGLGSNLTPIN